MPFAHAGGKVITDGIPVIDFNEGERGECILLSERQNIPGGGGGGARREILKLT